MQVEERGVKSLAWRIWIAYSRAGGGIWVGPLVVILLIGSQGANIVTSLWLSWWTSNKWGMSEGAYVSPASVMAVLSYGELTILDRYLFRLGINAGSPYVRLFHCGLGLWN